MSRRVVRSVAIVMMNAGRMRLSTLNGAHDQQKLGINAHVFAASLGRQK